MDKDEQVQLPIPAVGAPGARRLTKPRFSCRRWYLLTGTDKDDTLAPAISPARCLTSQQKSSSSAILAAKTSRPLLTKQWGELTDVYAPRQPRSNQRQREAERRRLRDRIYLPSVQHTLQQFRRPQSQAPFQGHAALSLLRVPPIGTDLLSDRLHSLRSSLEADPVTPVAPTPKLWCPQPPHRDQRPIAQRPQPRTRRTHRVREVERPEMMKDSFEQLLEDAESDVATTMSCLGTHVSAALSDIDTASSFSSLETHVCAALEAREYAINAVRDGAYNSSEDLLQIQSHESDEQNGGMNGYLTGTESDTSWANGSSISPSESESEASLQSSELQSDGVAEDTAGMSENDSSSVVSSQVSSKSAWSVDSVRLQSVVAAPDQLDSSSEHNRVVAEVVQSIIDSTQTNQLQEKGEVGEAHSTGLQERALDQHNFHFTAPVPTRDSTPAMSNSQSTEATSLPAPTKASNAVQLSAKAVNVSDATATERDIIQVLESMINSISRVRDELVDGQANDNKHPLVQEAQPARDNEPNEITPEISQNEEHAGEEEYTEAQIRSDTQAELSMTHDLITEADFGHDDLITEIPIQSESTSASPGTKSVGLSGAVPNCCDTLIESETHSDESHKDAALHDVKIPPDMTSLESMLAEKIVDTDDDDDYEKMDSEHETTNPDSGALQATAITTTEVPTAAEESEPDETYDDDDAGDTDPSQLLNDYETDFDFDTGDEDDNAQEYAFDGEDE